jgi:lysophospholipid acyltransferase (LPLAT)-like uncharacterized protein
MWRLMRLPWASIRSTFGNCNPQVNAPDSHNRNSEQPGDQQSAAYQQATRSTRRMDWRRQWLYRLGLPLALGLVRAFWASYRWRSVRGDRLLDQAVHDHGAVIPCFWHQHLMAAVPYLLGKQAGGLRAGFLISPSVDGEVGAMAARRLGGYIMRGSATYTGARALRDFYLAVAKEKVSPLITPDGPHGPRFVAKSGAILIAQLAGKPIIPISYAASRVFKFRAWDRFVLPLPFARIALVVGEPIFIPKAMTPAQVEDMQARLGQRLKELFAEACEELRSTKH